jgi:hypothetical protein
MKGNGIKKCERRRRIDKGNSNNNETEYKNRKKGDFNNIIKLKVGRVYTSNNFKSSYQYFV